MVDASKLDKSAVNFGEHVPSASNAPVPASFLRRCEHHTTRTWRATERTQKCAHRPNNRIVYSHNYKILREITSRSARAIGQREQPTSSVVKDNDLRGSCGSSIAERYTSLTFNCWCSSLFSIAFIACQLRCTVTCVCANLDRAAPTILEAAYTSGSKIATCNKSE